MSSLEALTGSKYLSFSSMESWLSCGEKYRLQKVVGVHQQQAWYLLGGSAVHEATEMLDTGVAGTPELAWQAAWEKQIANVTDFTDVRAGGRVSKQYPNKEDHTWWEVNGLEMVKSYAQHMNTLLSTGWTLLGVETAFEINIEGVEIRGFIDRVMANPDGEVEVHDIKTGSHTPAWTLQLGTYAHGAYQALGVMPSIGRYYMARSGSLTPQSSLLHYTPTCWPSGSGRHAKPLRLRCSCRTSPPCAVPAQCVSTAWQSVGLPPHFPVSSIYHVRRTGSVRYARHRLPGELQDPGRNPAQHLRRERRRLR